MKKINLKIFLPLLGIGVIGTSSVIAGTALSLENVSSSKKEWVSLNTKVLDYAMSNLIDPNILYSPIELANYLDNYGAFGNSSSNPIFGVDVLESKPNSKGTYDVKIRLNSSDSNISNQSTYWFTTSTPVSTDLGTINFDRLKNIFLNFNNISTAYEQIYTNSTLLELITNNTNLTTENINRVSINISNDFGSNNDMLSFNLNIVLNDGYSSNGKTLISLELMTSYIINWKLASENASKYFDINDNGVIIGIKDDALSEKVLIIPETYTTSTGYVNNIKSIQSLMPTNFSSSQNAPEARIIIMPNTIEIIGDNAFGQMGEQQISYTNLQWINLSKSLSSIGNNAFANCTSLENLYFQNLKHLITIGQNAFYNCSTFTDIYMDNIATSISSQLFNSCNNLLTVKLPRNITIIPNRLFSGCSSLKYVVIPKTVTQIGDYVFENCNFLLSVNIPYNLTSIGQYVFSGTQNLSNIVFLNNGNDNQINFSMYTFRGMSNKKYTNLYIFGEYSKSRIFWLTFNQANYINISVSSEQTFNRIVNDGNNFTKNRIFIMDSKNLPNVEVKNVDLFVKYWQEKIQENQSVDFSGKYVSSFKEGCNYANMLYWTDWVSNTVDIKKVFSQDNTSVVEVVFEATLNNGQLIIVNVPLLNPIIVNY